MAGRKRLPVETEEELATQRAQQQQQREIDAMIQAARLDRAAQTAQWAGRVQQDTGLVDVDQEMAQVAMPGGLTMVPEPASGSTSQAFVAGVGDGFASAGPQGGMSAVVAERFRRHPELAEAVRPTSRSEQIESLTNHLVPDEEVSPEFGGRGH